MNAVTNIVIPAKAGIQTPDERAVDVWMCLDSRLRGNDSDIVAGDFFEPRTPVSPGFYLASSYRETVPVVMKKIVDLLEVEWTTRMLEIYPRQESLTGPLVWVDSGNSFNSYHVARLAAERGLDPRRVLRSIQVARPFTAYQFQKMLEKIPPAFTSACSGVVSRRVPFVVISDVMGLFYDPEIQEDDRRRAYKEFLLRLSSLRQRAVVLGLLMNHVVPAECRSLLQPVLDRADGFLSFNNSPRPQIAVA